MFFFTLLVYYFFNFFFNRNSIKYILKSHEAESKVLITKFVDIKMLPRVLSKKEMENMGGAN
jgi:hypothetical protein